MRWWEGWTVNRIKCAKIRNSKLCNPTLINAATLCKTFSRNSRDLWPFSCYISIIGIIVNRYNWESPHISDICVYKADLMIYDPLFSFSLKRIFLKKRCCYLWWNRNNCFLINCELKWFQYVLVAIVWVILWITIVSCSVYMKGGVGLQLVYRRVDPFTK